MKNENLDAYEILRKEEILKEVMTNTLVLRGIVKRLDELESELADYKKFGLDKELNRLKGLQLNVGRFYKNRKGKKVYLYYKLYNGFQGVIDGYDHYLKFDKEGKATDYIPEKDGTTMFDIVDVWNEE